MGVKHFEDIYSWEQIFRLQSIIKFGECSHDVPVAVYAPYASSGPYEKFTPHCVKLLWNMAYAQLREKAKDALTYDLVPASECFSTIRYKDPKKAQDFCNEFKRLLFEYAHNGKCTCALGCPPGTERQDQREAANKPIVVPDYWNIEDRKHMQFPGLQSASSRIGMLSKNILWNCPKPI